MLLNSLSNVLLIFSASLVLGVAGCGRTPTESAGREKPPGGSEEPNFESIEEKLPPGDQSAGFFLDNWKPKRIQPPGYISKEKPTGSLEARIQVNTDNIIARVPPSIYGNNTNPYIGQMVTEPTLLKHLRALNPHLIRFPGGNLSNLYFWNRSPGDPPGDVPPADQLLNADGSRRTNEGYWYGKNQADWTLSLDNYYRMLEESRSEGIITVNYSYARYGKGSHPVQTAAGYAADWVRYDNGRTRYWEIGNENYGSWQAGYRIDTETNKNGQPTFITGRLYGRHVRIFADSMRKAARETGAEIKVGAQLIERNPSATDTEIIRNWNSGYFSSAGNTADYYVVHNYYTPYQQDSPAPEILRSAPAVTADMMQWMNQTTQANGVKLKPIALTEWNIFATGSRQMVSHISGMHAAMVLGKLSKYEYGMAARWDIANGWSDGNDHGMFNLGDAPGNVPRWKPRPDFYHMYYFQRFFGGRMVWSGTQGDPALESYASTFSSGQIGLVAVNASDTAITFDVQLKSASPGSRYFWYILEGGSEAPFSRKVFVNGQGPAGSAGGPANYGKIKAYSALTGDQDAIKVRLPGYSVAYMLIETQ